MTFQNEDPLTLLAAYLYQDWEDEFEDVDAALRALIRRSSVIERAALAKRVSELLAGSREEMASTLSLYVDYDYGRDGYTANAFLQSVLEKLTAPPMRAQGSEGYRPAAPDTNGFASLPEPARARPPLPRSGRRNA